MAQRKFAVIVLAAALVGLVAFVGACALIDSTGWFTSEEPDNYPYAEPPLIPPQWSPDGTKILLDWWGPFVVDTSSEGAKLRDITIADRAERIYPLISPDGSRIVFETDRYEADDDNIEIVIANLDGTEYRRLTKSRGNQHSPEWSPDSAQIAFISFHRPHEDGQYSSGLYVVASTGSSVRKLVDSVRPTGPLTWSPDGEKIAFLGYDLDQSGRNLRDRHIFTVDSDGSNLTKLAKAYSHPVWSPDSSTIAFLRGEDRNSLFVISAEGSGLRKVVELSHNTIELWEWTPYPNLSWSPDGSEIILQDYPFIRVKVNSTNYSEGEAPYAVFHGPDNWHLAYASWSPDGSRIAVSVESHVENGPNVGDAILLTMAPDGSDMRVLARLNAEYELFRVPNEPWQGEAKWVWHLPEK